MNAFLSEAVTEGEALHDLIDYYVADGRRAIEATGNMFRNRRYRRLAFAGMGSSYGAPFAVLDHLIAGGIPAIAPTAHKQARDRTLLVTADMLVVAISKTGATKELLDLAHIMGADAGIIGQAGGT